MSGCGGFGLRCNRVIPAKAGIHEHGPWRPRTTVFMDSGLRRNDEMLNLRDLLLVEELLKLAGLVHLHHDVGAADEPALHVELGDGGAVGIFPDPPAAP